MSRYLINVVASRDLRIVHIKNDPPIKSLKRRSLSGAVRVAFAFAKGSAIELIKFIGVGFGSAHPPDLRHSRRYRMDQSFLGLSLMKSLITLPTIILKLVKNFFRHLTANVSSL
jgi:hypothetical protein